MKHVKLFEDFGSFSNDGATDLIITNYGKNDATKLADKAREFGFPILRNPATAENYLKYGPIWAIENGSDIYFYQPDKDAAKPITSPSNLKMSLEDFCMEIGCDEAEFLSQLG